MFTVLIYTYTQNRTSIVSDYLNIRYIFNNMLVSGMNFKNFKSRWNTSVNYGETSPVKTKQCDVAGCTNRGEYKAPKSRYNLNDYFWFCLDHVKEYNSNWDYFKGMSPEEIETQMNQTILGDRPTWRVSDFIQNEERLKENIRRSFTSDESAFQDFTFRGENVNNKDGSADNFDPNHLPNTAIEALKVMDLYPPIDWKDVKKAYKKLVKKHHPDKNQGCTASEEKLKQINLAYSILKISYNKFESLVDK